MYGQNAQCSPAVANIFNYFIKIWSKIKENTVKSPPPILQATRLAALASRQGRVMRHETAAKQQFLMGQLVLDETIG